MSNTEIEQKNQESIKPKTDSVSSRNQLENKLIEPKTLGINFIIFLILSLLFNLIIINISGSNLANFLNEVANEQIAFKTIYLLGFISNSILFFYLWFDKNTHQKASYVFFVLLNTFYTICSTSIAVNLGKIITNGEFNNHFNNSQFMTTGSFFSVITLVIISYLLALCRYKKTGVVFYKSWLFWIFYCFVVVVMIPTLLINVYSLCILIAKLLLSTASLK